MTEHQVKPTNGRYKILRELGLGSLCHTFEAVDLSSNAHVALKLVIPELREVSPEFRPNSDLAKVMQNAFSVAQRVAHPNVLKTYEFVHDGNSIGYTMELAGDGSLASRMCSDVLAPIEETVRLLHQLSLGLQAIHEADITHRNLKPENILLFDDGTVKIGDFLNACEKDGRRPDWEEKGSVIGFIDYLAPEYILKSQVDWRSDIYGLGVLAYELATGKTPFSGNSVYETMTKRLKGDPSPPSSIRAECSAKLDTIILRAMQREPTERYQSAAEVADDLSAMLRD